MVDEETKTEATQASEDSNNESSEQDVLYQVKGILSKYFIPLSDGLKSDAKIIYSAFRDGKNLDVEDTLIYVLDEKKEGERGSDTEEGRENSNVIYAYYHALDEFTKLGLVNGTEYLNENADWLQNYKIPASTEKTIPQKKSRLGLGDGEVRVHHVDISRVRRVSDVVTEDDGFSLCRRVYRMVVDGDSA